MSHVFPRHCHADLPTAVAGDGCFIVDKDGKRYFDGSGGAAISCLGHSNKRIADAMKEQIDGIAFAHTRYFTSEPAEALADLLVEQTGGALGRVYFVSGGSEAIEAALKLARQYHLERGEPGRRHVIARRQSYHGNTLGALSAGGDPMRRAPFEPMLVATSHVAPCYPYAEKEEGETLEEYGGRAADSLEEEIRRLGDGTVAAFVAETVAGATLGGVPPVDGYFRRIREICDRHGVLLILDEVMCGMGRTGHLLAFEAEGIRPDILCIAKGLGAGYQPVGAMLCTEAIYDAIAGGTGFFQHGHSYLGHPVATAAALAVLREILERDLAATVRGNGEYIETALAKRFGQHPHVGDIRGRGHFWGLEFVGDKEAKEPFNPGHDLARKLKRTAMEHGLVCYPMSGTRDGRHGDHVLLAPPFIATRDELDGMVDTLGEALDKTIASLN